MTPEEIRKEVAETARRQGRSLEELIAAYKQVDPKYAGALLKAMGMKKDNKWMFPGAGREFSDPKELTMVDFETCYVGLYSLGHAIEHGVVTLPAHNEGHILWSIEIACTLLKGVHGVTEDRTAVPEEGHT